MKSALVLIDVQNGMFSVDNPVFLWETALLNIKHVIAQARNSQVPLFYIQHNAPNGKPLEHGTDAWQIHPEVAPAAMDIVIQKTTPDSFRHTNLQEELTMRDIEHLILAGFQTELCIDTTCRQAFCSGYRVTLLSDAHSTWDSPDLSALQIINHHNRILRWFADTRVTKDVMFF